MPGAVNITPPAIIETLLSDCIYKTDLYEIKRWTFSSHMKQVNGYNDCFCLVFVSNGEYSFGISRNVHEMHTGHIIIEKPHFEYSLFPNQGKCTVVNFSNTFYEKLGADPIIKNNSFFSNPSIISQMLLSNPVIDYLHYKALSGTSNSCRLEMDDTVFELLYEILNGSQIVREAKKSNFQNHHLAIIERAKEYIRDNFKEDIGLPEIAENSFASPFHFSRMFRRFTLSSPYQYLLDFRLKHSEILLKTTTMPIAEVAASSGFSNPDYFATAFKKKYKQIPTDYRKSKN